jgi:hypothetical protein
MMFQTRLWAAAFIIAVVIVGGFALSVPRAREVRETSSEEKASTATGTPPVTIHDSVKKGLHTITGSVTAPNACAAVSAEASFASSTEPIIKLDITISEDSGVCLQVPTEIPFSASVAAPAAADIEARVNGLIASTTQS